MKIIECTKYYYQNSLNFVDDNNVYVGYDYSRSCCEDFGFRIRDENNKELCSDSADPIEENWPDFNFDTEFFEADSNTEKGENEYVARFKLFNKLTGKTIILELYNCHNGYYGHGFSFASPSQIFQEGTL